MNHERIARGAIEWVANPRHVIGWKNIYTMQCAICGATADAIVQQGVKHDPDCLHLLARAALGDAEGEG